MFYYRNFKNNFLYRKMKGDEDSWVILKTFLSTGVIRCLSKIYASEFVGKLTGNADSATTLISISLTGSI